MITFEIKITVSLAPALSTQIDQLITALSGGLSSEEIAKALEQRAEALEALAPKPTTNT